MYLNDFAAQIQAKLKSAIDRHIAGVEAKERAPDFALQNEREAHSTFAKRKLEVFVGRERELAAIARYCAGAGEQPLVLHGRSGLGKSALMARAIADAEAAKAAPVIARFIGASAASSNLRALFASIIEDFAAHGIVAMPGEFEQDANKFNAQIEKLLSSTTSPAIIFLDALDQLQKPHVLGWLPAKLPKTLKLVVSVLDDAAYETDCGLYRDLSNRLAPDACLEIEPLDLSHGRAILSALEQHNSHRLQGAQRDYIIGKFEQAGASPLFLKTAYEIARSWKSYHVAGAGRFVLAEGTDGAIAQFIAELSSVHHHEPELVTRTLGGLAAAKNGLSAKELTEILSRDRAGVMQAISKEQFGVKTDKLPPSVWVRLNRDLSPFLVEKQIDDQPLLQFFHRQVAQVARAQHYEHCKKELHKALAAYFETQASEKKGRRVYAKRSLSELPYQLHHADNAARLGQILMSPDWMQQKLDAFGVRPLIDDYQYARTRAQQLIGQALELAAGPLARDGRQLAAQIIGRMSTDLVDDPTEAAAIDSLLKKARALVSTPALVPRWPSFTNPGGPEIRRFEGHTGSVNAVAFSPDGRHILSGGKNELRLWEVASGDAIARFDGDNRSITAVAFSPDGRQFVSASSDVVLWDAASAREIMRFGYNGRERVLAVAFSPDGRHIASGTGSVTDEWWDMPVRIFEVMNGREITCIKDPYGEVYAVAYSPDGRNVVSGGSYDYTSLRLWTVTTGREAARFEGHTDTVTAVAFSPDGQHIVSGSQDKTLRLWEVASRREIARFEGHTDTVTAVAFSPDGQHIVSGSQDKTLRLWEVASGREIARFDGHTGTVCAVAFSPDGRYIVSGSRDGTLRLWEAAQQQTRRYEGPTGSVNAVAFSPDGRHIVSGLDDKTLRLWEVASGREVARFEGGTSRVHAVAFSPDGRRIASGDDDKLRLWEVTNGHELASFAGHAYLMLAVAFSPDGQQIVFSSTDDSGETLRLCDAASGRELARFELDSRAAVRAVAFSPDGQHVVFGSDDGALRLWEVASRQSVLSPVRRYDHDDFARPGIYERFHAEMEAASRQFRIFLGQGGQVNAVAFSPDGRHIVSGSFDKTLWLREAASGREIHRFEGHTSAVKAVAFSPDGWHIVSGSDDRTLRLWDATRGGEVGRFDGEKFFCVALAPNGKSLAAGDEGGRVHLLDILVDESDKTNWLGGLAGSGGPRKPVTQPSAPSSPP